MNPKRALISSISILTGILFITMALPKYVIAVDYIFWTNKSPGTIGRANLDGSSANQSIISGLSNPYDVAADANYVYWVDTYNNQIGRANLDGSSPNYSLITGCNYPTGITVNGSYIYWGSYGNGAIGRANLDGSSPNQSFITGCSSPFGLSVNSSYIFWSNKGDGTIGRANLNGSSPNQSLISGCDNPLDALVYGSYLYWPENGSNYTIARANLDGSSPNTSFITGCGAPSSVAATGSYLYWANNSGGSFNSIGRATISGSGANQSFITGCNDVHGIAVGGDASLPVALSAFSAKSTTKGINLEWITASETDNLGFIIERCTEKSDWQQIASYQTHAALIGQGTTSSPSQYSYTDANVTASNSYTYRLSDVSSNGEIEVIGSTAVEMSAIPATTQLLAAYPNPFNPSTHIKYQLANDSHVTLQVYDVLGRQVKMLVDRQQVVGEYSAQWDGTSDAGHTVPSGIYLVRLQVNGHSHIQKVSLMK